MARQEAIPGGRIVRQAEQLTVTVWSVPRVGWSAARPGEPHDVRLLCCLRAAKWTVVSAEIDGISTLEVTPALVRAIRDALHAASGLPVRPFPRGVIAMEVRRKEGENATGS